MANFIRPDSRKDLKRSLLEWQWCCYGSSLLRVLAMLASRRLGQRPELQKASGSNADAVLPGAKGEHVAVLQNLLVDLGAKMSKSRRDGKFDGVFGEETKEAVKAFQGRSGLKQDGIVGPKTLAALDKLVLSRNALETPGAEEIAKERVRDATGPRPGSSDWWE